MLAFVTTRKSRWAAQQPLLALRQNFGPTMTTVADQLLTTSQIHASQVRTWRTSFGARPARPAPVFENNRFAPALKLPNHTHCLLTIRWHLGTFFPIPPTNPRASAQVKQLRLPLKILSAPPPRHPIRHFFSNREDPSHRSKGSSPVMAWCVCP